MCVMIDAGAGRTHTRKIHISYVNDELCVFGGGVGWGRGGNLSGAVTVKGDPCAAESGFAL